MEGTETGKCCPCSDGGYHFQLGWLVEERMVEVVGLGSIMEGLKCWFCYMGY